MKIAIAGYGIEGRSSYKYWSDGSSEIVILDEREAVDNLPADAHIVLGKHAFEDLATYDMVVRSPSIPPKRVSGAKKVWSATNEFFEKCPAPIIGVTGTKGKGTTSSFIKAILHAAGKTVHLVGNIGQPALRVLPNIQADHIVVYELSSFQLWDIEASPQVAVVLGIEPDHLDIHENLDDYIAAKANIVRFQAEADTVVYLNRNEFSRKIGESSRGQKRIYPGEMSEFAASLQIPGTHNIENASAAVVAVQDFVTDLETIKQGLASFTGLPHRLKFVAEKNGVQFYDDSIATTPGSAIAAIKSFEQPPILLLGGRDKGSDYSELINLCNQRNVRVVAYGENRDNIKQLCDDAEVQSMVTSGDMSSVVNSAMSVANHGDVIILSPAAASFDMFKNYADRGEQFVAAVEAL